jgi:hypothetical protein
MAQYDGQLNRLQLYQGKWLPGMITETKLADAYKLQPYKIAQTISYAFGVADDQYQSSLDFVTGKNLPHMYVSI